MDSVLRAALMYIFLLIFIRIMGKRSLAQVTIFDFILLLIIGDTVQQGILGEDFSITNSLLVVATLFTMEIAFAFIKERFPAIDKVIDGLPVILIDNGKLMWDRIKQNNIDKEEILKAARESQGLENLSQIKYAILERNGGISIIPFEYK